MHTLGEVIMHNASSHPHGEAMICGSHRLDWSGYAEQVLTLADALYRLGLRRQERAAILAMNSLEYYELYGACSTAGFITASINFRLAPAEIDYILSDAAPKVLFFEAQYGDVVDRLRESHPDITHFVCIGDAAPDWAMTYRALLNTGSGEGPPIRARPNDAPYLLYTSGTTGRPKGVMHTHHSVCAAAMMTALASQFTGQSRVLQTSPAFHSGGVIYVNCASWTGGTAVIHREFQPEAVLETIESERITHTFMVPAMLQAVLDSPDIDRRDVSSIRVIHSAAAPIPVPVLKRAIEQFGPVFALQYGSTETFSICSMAPHEVTAKGPPEQVKRLSSVGQPIQNVGVRIVDEDGNDCPIGKPGELLVQSDSNLRSYWNNHAATIDAFTDGWYHTGDIGYFDENRYVFLVDRKKDMIISGGENIYSREVENALLEHTEVEDAAVIGVPDEKWGEAVTAIVKKRGGSTLDDKALIAHCRNLIAAYKCPKQVAFIDELPRQGTGKVDKVSLRKRYGEHS